MKKKLTTREKQVFEKLCMEALAAKSTRMHGLRQAAVNNAEVAILNAHAEEIAVLKKAFAAFTHAWNALDKACMRFKALKIHARVAPIHAWNGKSENLTLTVSPQVDAEAIRKAFDSTHGIDAHEVKKQVWLAETEDAVKAVLKSLE